MQPTLFLVADASRVTEIGSSISSHFVFVLQAICKQIREIAKPYIDDYGPKYKLDSIEFESLTLGSLPPTITGTLPPNLFYLSLCMTSFAKGLLPSWF